MSSTLDHHYWGMGDGAEGWGGSKEGVKGARKTLAFFKKNVQTVILGQYYHRYVQYFFLQSGFQFLPVPCFHFLYFSPRGGCNSAGSIHSVVSCEEMRRKDATILTQKSLFASPTALISLSCIVSSSSLPSLS